MAQQIYDWCLEVFPDIDRDYLRSSIIEMVIDFELAEVFHDTPIEEVHISNEYVKELTALVVEYLLGNGYAVKPQETEVPNDDLPLVDLTSISTVTASTTSDIPSNNSNNSISSEVHSILSSNVVVPEVEKSKSLTRSPSSSSPSSSVDEINSSIYQASPADMKNYKLEAIGLLMNEFRWFYKASISKTLGSCQDSFTKTRKVLQEVIKPYVGTTKLNESDPLNPDYPDLSYKGDERKISHTGHGDFNLLSNPRESRAIHLVSNAKLHDEINQLRVKQLTKKIQKESEAIECQCCFENTKLEKLVTCSEGHIFCQNCLNSYVKVQIELGVKNGILACMESDCRAQFPRSTLTAKLKAELLEKLEERIAAFNVHASGISDLVRCPKCQTQFSLEHEEKVLMCSNCNFASCRLCYEAWDAEHVGKTCEEVSSRRGTRLRRRYEEEMSKAIIRQCPRCNTELIKTDGCNKMSCPCGGSICYICREPDINYNHFCRDVTDPGKPCRQCSKCNLWADSTPNDKRIVERMEAESRRLEDVDTDRPGCSSKGDTPTLERKRPLTPLIGETIRSSNRVKKSRDLEN